MGKKNHSFGKQNFLKQANKKAPTTTTKLTGSHVFQDCLDFSLSGVVLNFFFCSVDFGVGFTGVIPLAVPELIL